MREAFIAAMRIMGASVAIVATRRGREPLGLTVSAVCSVSADPPHLLVCVNRDAEAHDPMGACGRFAVNLLGTRHRELADRFAGRTGVDGPARFASGTWQDGEHGCPVLADAAAVVECRVAQSLRVASHTVFVGEVLAVRSRPDVAPLAYRDGAYVLFAGLDDVPGAP